MIPNYKKHSNGVIEQIEKNPITYDYEYADNYNTYGELGPRMAYLRLGHVIGSLGFIPNSILDMGYGNGDFLKACSNIIPNCYGTDISSYPIPEGTTFVESAFSQQVDIITMYDVLEHFEDITFVKNLPCDYVCISLPWCHYESDEWFANWKHRKPNEHLFHFNKESLITFLQEQGYECINTTSLEDIIRKSNQKLPNILTGIFKKR